MIYRRKSLRNNGGHHITPCLPGKEIFTGFQPGNTWRFITEIHICYILFTVNACKTPTRFIKARAPLDKNKIPLACEIGASAQCDLPVLSCCIVYSAFKMNKFVIGKLPKSVQDSRSGASNSKVPVLPKQYGCQNFRRILSDDSDRKNHQNIKWRLSDQIASTKTICNVLLFWKRRSSATCVHYPQWDYVEPVHEAIFTSATYEYYNSTQRRCRFLSGVAADSIQKNQVYVTSVCRQHILSHCWQHNKINSKLVLPSAIEIVCSTTKWPQPWKVSHVLITRCNEEFKIYRTIWMRI